MGWQHCFNHGSFQSRGVCILSKPSLDANISKSFICDRGRIIILDISIHSMIFTLVCLYAPNFDDPSFFDTVNNCLSNFSCENIVIGWDYNFTFNLALDKRGGLCQTNFKARDHCCKLWAFITLLMYGVKEIPRLRFFPGCRVFQMIFTAVLTFSLYPGTCPAVLIILPFKQSLVQTTIL